MHLTLGQDLARSLCCVPEQGPLTPKSDWHLISPYNITLESNIEVMRIEEMIAN